MTKTEVLRSLLDERGIEWNGFEPNPWVKTTSWDIDASDPKYGVEAGFDEFDDGVTLLRFWNATPEQAIVATLGTWTCQLKQASWDDGTCTWGCICTACDAHLEHETGYGYNFCPNCGRRVVPDD